MRPADLIAKYMEAFYDSGDIDSLEQVLHPDLLFEGPLFQFDNAADYINSLRQSPPAGMHYEIIERFNDDDTVCLIYRFRKQDKTTTMVQTFTIDEGLIRHIRLVFDTADIC